MPMQRDAMRTGAIPDLNTEDPAIIAKAGRDLAQLTPHLNIKVAITDYQTLPGGKTWLHHSWSGDLLSAALYYMPKGVSPDVLSFWAPDQDGVVQNDLLFVPNAKKPVLAHAFLNFMLDEKNAYNNFVQFIGYTPPQNTIDADSLIKKGLIPKSLARAVLRPDQFAKNQELLALTTRATTSGRTPGRSSRPAECSLAGSGACSPLPASRGSRSSSWSRCTRCCASRSATRTRSRSRCRSGTRSTGTSATWSTRCDFWDGGQFYTVFVRTLAYVVDRARPVARDRLPGRLLRGAPRGALAGARAAAARAAVLDQLPDAHAGVDQPALARRLGHAVPARIGIDTLFVHLGLLSQDGGWLDGQSSSVVIALVYGYIPFLILPLFAALDRIDQRHIEAARDLGASPFAAFLRVTLPLSMPGILAGVVLIALPMFGDYYTPDLISASPRTNMIGNQIDQFTRQGSQKTVGAVLTMLLALVLLMLMLYYLRTTRRADPERARLMT